MMEMIVRSHHCHDHGRLMLDLALGCLGDEDAARAEQMRTSCATCREWWTANLEGQGPERLDRAVAEVFTAFQAPRRRRLSPWLSAAAAALVVLCLAALWHMSADVADRSSHPSFVDVAGGQGTDAVNGEVIAVFDFESGTSSSPDSAVLDSVSMVDFESGTLDSWTPNT
jgi:hypothetical protein